MTTPTDKWRCFVEDNLMLICMLIGTLAGMLGIALLVAMAYYLPWWAYFGLWILLTAWGAHRIDVKRRTA